MLTLLALASLFFRGGLALDCKVAAATTCNTWTCIIASAITDTTCTGTNQKCNTITSYATGSSPEQYTIAAACADTTATGYDCIFTSACDVTCNNYCTTTGCNNPYTVSTTTSSAISCVQCTGEGTTDSCYNSPPSATTCSDATHQYCTMMHTAVLDSTGAITRNVVFRGCSVTDQTDGCWTDYTQVDGGADTRTTSISCSKTCNTAGCNSEALPMTNVKGSGVVCETCMSTNGPCTSIVSATCLADQSYCYSKVIYTEGDYYHERNDVDTKSYEVQVVYEEKGCRAAAVAGACTTITSDVAGSNLNVISCEETCTGDRCNDDWPLRPKCIQCEGKYWNSGSVLASGDSMYYDHCALTPPTAEKCPDPSYRYCYAAQRFVPDGDNEVEWGYSKVFTRGCLKQAEVAKCFDYKFKDEREAHFCRHVCSSDDCNQGSFASSLIASGATVMAAALLTRVV